MNIDKSKWISLGIKTLGATYSGVVIGYVRNFVPQLALSNEVLTTLVGLGLMEGGRFVKFLKNKMIRDFGEGIFLAGLSQIIASRFGSGGTFHYANRLPMQQKTRDQNMEIYTNVGQMNPESYVQALGGVRQWR